jgi:hypothetical protein
VLEFKAGFLPITGDFNFQLLKMMAFLSGSIACFHVACEKNERVNLLTKSIQRTKG